MPLRLEGPALITNRRFKCKALSGESSYNICINADSSVSCNCDDIYGHGRLGRLEDNTFEEVFSGPVATQFRESLAAGKIPIPKCAACPELQQVSVEEAQRAVDDYALPHLGLMLENNAGCNLSCLGCGRAQRPLERLKMSIAEMGRIAQEIARVGVRRIHFFSLGEPFMSKNVLDELRVIREHNPVAEIFTSTTGMLLNNDDKRRAALMMDEVLFSIDGSSQETAERYQVGIDFEMAIENMAKLVAARDASGSSLPHIGWKHVMFNWNDRKEHLDRVLQLAAETRVDSLEFVFTLNPYYAVSTRFLYASHWRELGPLQNKRRRRQLR